MGLMGLAGINQGEWGLSDIGYCVGVVAVADSREGSTQ